MNGTAASAQPPTAPGAPRNGSYNRPPPSGPSRSYGEPQMSPPSGPAAAPISMSAHNRPAGPSVLAAPTRPRNQPPGRFDGPPRDFSAPIRRPNPTYRAPSTLRSSSYEARDVAPPPGPRGGYGRGEAPGGYESRRPSFNRNEAPPFRHHNNSTSTTYPRSQRFNTSAQHLATSEKLVSGGKLFSSGLTSDQQKRMKQLEDDAEKLREVIEEKQRTKREYLGEWEVRERESDREGLKSELAERHLEKLTEGEDGVGRAAF